jgi:hypothetical protein
MICCALWAPAVQNESANTPTQKSLPLPLVICLPFADQKSPLFDAVTPPNGSSGCQIAAKEHM